MTIVSYKPCGSGAGFTRHPKHAEELGRLLPLWLNQLEDQSLEGRRRLVTAIRRALRAERKRGRAGHWAYDLARHAALHRAWERECQELAHLERHMAGIKWHQRRAAARK